MPTEQPAYLFHLRIDEPLILLTDLTVTLVSVYAYLSLRKRAKEDITVWCMNRYFFFLALGTFLGGFLGHSLVYLLNPRWKLLGWISGMVAVTFAELAAVNQLSVYLKETMIRVLRRIIFLEFAVLLVITCLKLKFFWVEFHSVFGLLLVFTGVQVFLLRRKNNLASIYSLIAIGILLLSVTVFGFEFRLTSWMSHYYTSHLLMAVSVWFNYKGVVHLM